MTALCGSSPSRPSACGEPASNFLHLRRPTHTIDAVSRRRVPARMLVLAIEGVTIVVRRPGDARSFLQNRGVHVMPQSHRILSSLCLLLAGYAVGVLLHGEPLALRAQDNASDYESETIASVQAAHRAINEAASALEGENRYTTVIDGVNAFAVMVGGLDAVRDLEENRGVDPETFASLYAGRATPEVFPHIGYDSKGRLTYKGNLVRIYSRETLKKLYDRRDQLIRSR